MKLIGTYLAHISEQVVPSFYLPYVGRCYFLFPGPCYFCKVSTFCIYVSNWVCVSLFYRNQIQCFPLCWFHGKAMRTLVPTDTLLWIGVYISERLLDCLSKSLLKLVYHTQAKVWLNGQTRHSSAAGFLISASLWILAFIFSHCKQTSSTLWPMWLPRSTDSHPNSCLTQRQECFSLPVWI